jgi:hypothetical protein
MDGKAIAPNPPFCPALAVGIDQNLTLSNPIDARSGPRQDVAEPFSQGIRRLECD